MKPYLICPSCGSDDVMKNGTTRRGKQNYKCRDCGRQFVENPQWKPVDPDSKAILDRLLLERIPLAGIAPVLQVGEAWLQGYVNRLLRAVPRRAQVQPKAQGSYCAPDG
jgi:insertion element IS1 protein InsB